MRLLARTLLAASLTLNAFALIAYFVFSQGSSTRDTAARSASPRKVLSEEATQDLLLILESHGLSLVNSSAGKRLNSSDELVGDKSGSVTESATLSEREEEKIVLDHSTSSFSLQLLHGIGTVLSSLRALLLLLPAVFGSAAFAATYWQVVAWRRPLVLATAASFVMVSIAQVAGAEGATTAVWLYVVVSFFGFVHALYTSDGISRAVLFWRLIGRMILHYKLVRWWSSNSDLESPELESVYSKLHHAYAPQVCRSCTAVRPRSARLMPRQQRCPPLPTGSSSTLCVLLVKGARAHSEAARLLHQAGTGATTALAHEPSIGLRTSCRVLHRVRWSL